MADNALNDLLSDNERLRQVNDALRQRMERHGAPEDHSPRLGEGAPEHLSWIRRYIEVALEASSAALALFTEEGRLLAPNSKLSALFPDVASMLVPGARFEEVVRHIANSGSLDLPSEATRAAWAQARLAAKARGGPPVVVPLRGDRWLEISERRAGQGAFALAFEDVTDAVIARRRDRRGAGGGRDGLVREALEHLAIGVGAFDAEHRIRAWNEPFRTLLGLGLGDIREGDAFADIAATIAATGVVDSDGSAGRLGEWLAWGSPRPPLTVELTRRDGLRLDIHCRETPEGGFVLSLTDVTAEREAVAEINRVKETLERRVFERTAALVDVNDKLVQEIAERRAIEAEMRRARDVAEAANHSKTRFLAAASHDLLQPLNAAKLFVSALNASNLPEREAAVAHRIESAFSSVETLLNALLDISKLDAGGGEVTVTDFPIARILEPVAEEFRVLAASRGLRLSVVPSSLVVRSDAHYLRRVIQNLLGNALKYTMEGGVVLGCRRRGDTVRIEVWDSGIGIPENERRRVFEEFHRIDLANPRAERGMGLGLAIVDRACRLLDHPVDVRSVEGAGSMFAVTVPLGAAIETEPRLDDAAPLDIGLRDGGMIALLIEDDPAVRAATAALLDRWGVDALEAESTESALEIVRQLGMAPDVVLLDYHLGPDETGLDALARLRADIDPALPAIMITADRTRAVALEAERARAQMLTKPVAPAKLRSLLYWSQRAQG
jgi:signal transduction histidine kinase